MRLVILATEIGQSTSQIRIIRTPRMGISEEAPQAEVEEEYSRLKSQPPHNEEQVALIKRLIELHLVTFKYYEFERTKDLVHEGYKQHSPLVGDGQNSIIEAAKLVRSWVEPKWEGPGEPHANMQFKRVLVDGPYMIVQHHTRRWEGDRGHHVIDIYRVKDGRFAEHWESVMEVPPENELKHSNGLF